MPFYEDTALALSSPLPPSPKIGACCKTHFPFRHFLSQALNTPESHREREREREDRESGGDFTVCGWWWGGGGGESLELFSVCSSSSGGVQIWDLSGALRVLCFSLPLPPFLLLRTLPELGSLRPPVAVVGLSGSSRGGALVGSPGVAALVWRFASATPFSRVFRWSFGP